MKKGISELLGAELEKTAAGMVAKVTNTPPEAKEKPNNEVGSVNDASIVNKKEQDRKEGTPTAEDKKIGNEANNGDEAVGSAGLEGKTITEGAIKKISLDLGNYFKESDVDSHAKVAGIVAEAKELLSSYVEKTAEVSEGDVKASIMAKMAFALETLNDKNAELVKEASHEKFAEKLVLEGVYESKEGAKAWVKFAEEQVGSDTVGFAVEQRIRAVKVAYADGIGEKSKQEDSLNGENALTRLFNSN